MFQFDIDSGISVMYYITIDRAKAEAWNIQPFAQTTLTSSLLSKLAFLKEEVTELASFSAIHALKSLTANEAAMPVKKKKKSKPFITKTTCDDVQGNISH